jgi:predicted secreted protein
MIETAAQFETDPGNEVVLRLDRHGVGGYLWTIGSLPAGLRLAGEPVQESGGPVGSGATVTYRLIAVVPGTHVAVFELRRPWGECDLAERRTVTVSAAAR